MAYIKPGSEVKGYVWTGKRWVKKPERQSEKVTLQKEINLYSKNTEGSGAGARRVRESQMRTTKASYPGGAPRMSSGMPTSKLSTQTTKGYVPMRSKSSMKAKTTNDSGRKDFSATPSSSKTSKTSKGLTAGGGRAKTPLSKSKPVSQSRTMWVKKGDVVGGKTVQKGYLAQYGKPEKKVTARVRLVAGEKAGQKVTYRKGRKAK